MLDRNKLAGEAKDGPLANNTSKTPDRQMLLVYGTSFVYRNRLRCGAAKYRAWNAAVSLRPRDICGR